MSDVQSDDSAINDAFREWLRPSGIEIAMSGPDEQGRITAAIDEFGLSEQGADQDEAIERVAFALVRYANSFLDAGKPLPHRRIPPDIAKDAGENE